MTKIVEPFGIAYNIESAGLKKCRAAARYAGGLNQLSKAQRSDYGIAVESAIIAKQRAELRREFNPPAPNCASGTPHSDGAKISAAIRAQQRADLMACPARERKARSPLEWESMYREAMVEKLARLQAGVRDANGDLR